MKITIEVGCGVVEGPAKTRAEITKAMLDVVRSFRPRTFAVRGTTKVAAYNVHGWSVRSAD